MIGKRRIFTTGGEIATIAKLGNEGLAADERRSGNRKAKTTERG